MSDLENYDTIYKKIKRRELINAEMRRLLSISSNVRTYAELLAEDEKLKEATEDVFKNNKYHEYNNCSHVFVNTLSCIGKRNRPYTYCGCIKCGLTDMVENIDKDDLTISDKVKYDYLEDLKKQGKLLDGKMLNINCDLSLAQAIYSKIRDAHPFIDESLKIKYFEIALDNIRNITVSEERKKSRAVRLSLEPSFNAWYSDSIEK